MEQSTTYKYSGVGEVGNKTTHETNTKIKTSCFSSDPANVQLVNVCLEWPEPFKINIPIWDCSAGRKCSTLVWSDPGPPNNGARNCWIWVGNKTRGADGVEGKRVGEEAHV